MVTLVLLVDETADWCVEVVKRDSWLKFKERWFQYCWLPAGINTESTCSNSSHSRLNSNNYGSNCDTFASFSHRKHSVTTAFKCPEDFSHCQSSFGQKLFLLEMMFINQSINQSIFIYIALNSKITLQFISVDGL